MMSILLIATTLLTRGVNNMQEAAFLFAAPPIAVANYTYHYLDNLNLNYTDLAQGLLSMRNPLFTSSLWFSEEQMSSVLNTTGYWMREIPAMATQIPKQMYQRMLTPEIRYVPPQLDIGMLFVGMYLTSLFTLAAAIWLLNPGGKHTYEEVDSDHILVRKRKRTPQRYYDEGRMQLRSMTSDEDIFYELE